MKNCLLIIVLIAVTFWAIHLLDAKTPYSFGTVGNVDVQENTTTIDLNIDLKEVNQSWFYDYELVGNQMYVHTYRVVNPRADKILSSPLTITVDKGYLDFSHLYLCTDQGEQLIWEVS